VAQKLGLLRPAQTCYSLVASLVRRGAMRGSGGELRVQQQLILAELFVNTLPAVGLVQTLRHFLVYGVPSSLSPKIVLSRPRLALWKAFPSRCLELRHRMSWLVQIEAMGLETTF